MKYFFLVIFSLVIYALPAQDYRVSYEYDTSGGRTSRKIKEIVLPQSRSFFEVEQPIQEDDIVSLEDADVNEVKIYPNPTKGSLTIELTGSVFDIQGAIAPEIALYDASGRQLQNQRTEVSLFQLDLSSYSPGWYLLIIRGGAERQEYKIIKE